MAKYDAVVVGSGPNGLCAAIRLAQAGRSVVVFEARDRVGGGVRSAELTLPGFVHDVCSAVHPMAVVSPFLKTLPLGEHGLEWVHPTAPLAHPFDDGQAAVLERSLDATCRTLGADGDAYRRLVGSIVDDWPKLESALLGPLRIPAHPIVLSRFGLRSIWSARHVANRWFRGEPARGFFAGLAAHSILPMERPPSAAVGLVLGTVGHVAGWPIPRGGAQCLADALTSYLRSLGGEVVLGQRIDAMEPLPDAAAYLFDLTPRQVNAIAGDALPKGYRRRLSKYRYGMGVYKVDWALDGPIPWTATECARAATIHVGGTYEEIAASERDVWAGKHCAQPFVLLVQHSLFDPTRAPEGKHTAWGYCHVPPGSTVDMTDQIERQIERFAPGFRARILARHTMNSVRIEEYNANYIGGDVNGGVQDLWQLFTRPTVSVTPYATPNPKLFLCSASTPPGGGVHGMAGYHAAMAVLKRVFQHRGDT